MPTVVSVVGAGEAGKTSLIEKLLPRLQSRGLRVGTVKHAAHGHQVDRDGSDSSRHLAANASPVLLTGPDGYVLFSSAGESSLPDLIARYFHDTDLVLVEGYAGTPGRKILVHRRDIAPKEPPPSTEVLFAVTDEPLGFPIEIDHEGLDKAVDLIVEARRDDDAGGTSPIVTLRVDGREVSLRDFAGRAIAGVITGLVGELHGIPAEPEEIELSVAFHSGAANGDTGEPENGRPGKR
ncbi:MAG: hypothetical protein JJLCMIEE_00013 [Acidimicrobiales bacterium]|nr:MAG: molybdopterin-guanine dinucleotide biosynthesis protein B [Actinomycetota bacterium]MBV6506976.1 hypothetical protein [Acidimicrobiales bacterium]RIK05788.1 MAG: molybdopterin-guanine dinucleotide biosynthesis protein B [Acidobacteriota bacterium]